MKNRERLLRQNEYDLLMSMQRNLLHTTGDCVLDLVDWSSVRECPHNCSACIQEWLNEEASSE